MARPRRAPPRRPRRRAPSAPGGAIDARLLAALESDARLSFADLGERIGLSKTPTWARVRALERAGTITGYRAEVDPVALGLELHAFVEVRVRAAQHAEFEAAVLGHPAVLECFTTAGQADYLLHVLVGGIADLDALLRDEVSRLPGVERLATTVGMKTIKHRARITDCASWAPRRR
jgi:Lrp/AsnC family leucine-responsive transcriptional regulator